MGFGPGLLFEGQKTLDFEQIKDWRGLIKDYATTTKQLQPILIES
jgi:hypothetical protein